MESDKKELLNKYIIKEENRIKNLTYSKFLNYVGDYFSPDFFIYDEKDDILRDSETNKKIELNELKAVYINSDFNYKCDYSIEELKEVIK